MVIPVDIGLRKVAKNASFAFLLRIIATALTFAFNLMLARSLGREGTGVYYLCLSIVTFSSILCRFGFDNALVRHVSADLSVGNPSAAKALVRYAKGITLLVSASLTVAGFFAAPWIAGSLFHSPGMTGILRLMLLALTPFSLFQLNSWALKGAGRPVAGVMVAGALPALTLAVGFLMILFFFPGARSVSSGLAFLVSSVVTWFVSGFLWRGVLDTNVVPGQADFSRLFVSAWPLLVVALSHYVMKWIDMYILGFLLDTATVGSYAVAVRIADLSAFVLFAVNATTAPQFSRLHAGGNTVELARLAKRVSLFMTLAILPVTIAILLAPGLILGVFGPEFKVAAGILQVLALAQFVNVYTGPVGQLLMMTGHEKDMRNNALIFALVSVALNLLLIPIFGPIGAAIASALSLSSRNLFAAWLVKKRLGFSCLPLPRIPGFGRA